MLTIDFETVDPYLTSLGGGWIFYLNHNKDDFKLLGASVKVDDTDTYYVTDREQLKFIILQHNELVMHNAVYDVGCMLALFKGDDRFNLKEYLLVDTVILAKLDRQDLYSYDLASCGSAYNLDVTKDSQLLWDYAWDSGLYQKHINDLRGINKVTRETDSVLDKFCKTHLDQFPEELVAKYCNLDVEATYTLYKYLEPTLKGYDHTLYSDLIKLMVEVSLRGINVDNTKIVEAYNELTSSIDRKKQELFTTCNTEFNPNSVPQTVLALKAVGVAGFKKTPKGADSIGADWLKDHPHPACQKLVELRQVTKARDSFVGKLAEYQKALGLSQSSVGIIYPTFRLLGATATGRFTSGADKPGSLQLNIQQIPARDPEIGAMCRALFIPPKGKKWVSADYSNQEQRLQVHFAAKWGLEGAAEVALAWTNDPHLDYHLKVAAIVGFLCSNNCGECDTCKVGRRNAKTINLGLSYGMGGGKLCMSLGLPTAIWKTPEGNNVVVAGDEGKALLEKYHTLLPFMKGLQDNAASEFMLRGTITTIGGRKIGKSTEDGFDQKGRKGLSKLIQGSAADQIMKALQNCYKSGLEVVATIHDEINIVSDDPRRDALLLNRAMSETYSTLVPMIADIGVGDSWGDSKA